MIGRRVARGALVILSIWIMLSLTWQSGPALAGFTPTPRPTEIPALTPPSKEPKDSPTPIGLTATPGLLPIAGAQTQEPGLFAVIIVGTLIVLTAGVMAYRGSGAGPREM
jgi:hypothetical protein